MTGARAAFGREIAGLRAAVMNATRRLSDLERGRRTAQAAEAVRRLRGGSADSASATALADAEATLKRLRQRQLEEAEADAALRRIDAETAPSAIAERLEAEGFGKRTRSTAASVLERLRQRGGQAPA